MVYAKDENYSIQYLIEVVALPPLNPTPKCKSGEIKRGTNQFFFIGRHEDCR